MTYLTLTEAMSRFGLRRTQIFGATESGDIATTSIRGNTVYLDSDLKTLAKRIAQTEQRRVAPPVSAETQREVLSTRRKLDDLFWSQGKRLSGGTISNSTLPLDGTSRGLA